MLKILPELSLLSAPTVEVPIPELVFDPSIVALTISEVFPTEYSFKDSIFS